MKTKSTNLNYYLLTKKTTLLTALLLLLFVIIQPTYSQVNISIGSQKTLGGNWTDEGVAVKKLNDGYVAVIRSQSPISYDKTAPFYGYIDYWLVGLDASLIPIWQQSLGGTLVDQVYDMIVTDNNEIIIVGVSDSPISGNKTVANYGTNNIWVICTDSVGNIKWQNIYGGSLGEGGSTSIIQLDNGNFAIGTSSGSDISGTKSENCRGNSDYWVFSIDPQGNQLWDKTFGGTMYERFVSLVQISPNEIVLAGFSNSNSSGEKTENRIGTDTLFSLFENLDVWVVKYNFVSNQVVWDKTLGGDDEELINVVVAYADGAIFVASSSRSGISGTKTTPFVGIVDIWLNKLDTAGNILFQKNYGGSGFDAPYFMTSINDAIIVGASSSSTISATKSENPVTTYSRDYWVFSIDHSGNVLWDKTIGGYGEEDLASMYIENENHMVLIGSSLSDISGHKTEAVRVPGHTDAWLVELHTTVGIEAYYSGDNGFSIYPNPATDIINIALDNNVPINEISIYSQLGELIKHNTNLNNTIDINVSHFASGIYFIECVDNKGNRFTSKFIKQ